MGLSKMEKQKQKLIELGVMEPEDTLVDFLQASYVERLIGKMGKWKQGWAYFTENRVAGREYRYSLQNHSRAGKMFSEFDADWNYDYA